MKPNSISLVIAVLVVTVTTPAGAQMVTPPRPPSEPPPTKEAFERALATMKQLRPGSVMCIGSTYYEAFRQAGEQHDRDTQYWMTSARSGPQCVLAPLHLKPGWGVYVVPIGEYGPHPEHGFVAVRLAGKVGFYVTMPSDLMEMPARKP